MRLQDLEKFENITIQCHDNPDADAIASGYGLYCYFKSKGKNVRLIYSGHSVIQKSNLVLMLEKLQIPIEYVVSAVMEGKKFEGLLITVDCQYGAGNVTRFEAENVAIIDHHQIEVNAYEHEYMEIASELGSCSTLVWLLLKEEGYEVTDENKLATALYYGLLSDTNGMSEVKNPIDRDMQDALPFNGSLISMFTNSNISLRELEIAGVAMLRYVFNEEYHFAVVKTQACDANILGLISDFLLQVDQIYTCVVYNEIEGGFKFSVRSCVREVNASELAGFLAKDIGSGGGHARKAGGFISKKLYDDKMGAMHSEGYVNNQMIKYFENYDLIYPNEFEVDLTKMKKYQKNDRPVGFVRATDVLPVGTPVTIRTLEGDVDLVVEDDLIIMIGIEGEVYPSKLEKFERSYRVLDKKYVFEECVIHNKYVPTIKNRLNGEKYSLADYASVCSPTGKVQIYAKPLEKPTKVFTEWNQEGYMRGKAGDLLAVRTDDLHDAYIIDLDIFNLTYDLVEE